MKKRVKNNLYQLYNSISNQIFLFNEITRIIKSFDNFQKIYKRLNYTKIYRLRDLYKYAKDVKEIKISK